MWVWGSGLNIPLVSPPSLLLSHLNVHIINAHFALSHRNLTETYQSWMFEYILSKVLHFHILFWAKLFKLHRAESFFLILLTFYSNLCRESPSNLKSIMPSTYKYDKILFKGLSKHRHYRISFAGRKLFCMWALIRLQKSNWHFNKCNATKLLTPLHLLSLWCTSWVKLKRNLFGAIQLFWLKVSQSISF